MTITEDLRKMARRLDCKIGFSCSKYLADEFGIECGEVSCGECYARLFERIADRIEAETDELRGLRGENERLRGMVREQALPDGIEWPRFEDGELVKVGDTVGSDEPFTAKEIAFESERWLIKASSRSVCGYFHGAFGEPVKRPTPKVLGADGAPIEVGDTVYCDGEDEQLIVDSFDGPGCVCVTLAKSPSGMLYTIEPSRLSHERPDSWERIEEDAAKRVCEYAGAQKSIADADRYTCLECPYDVPGPHTDAGCHERMRLDLMRRAKALAKADEQG